MNAPRKRPGPFWLFFYGRKRSGFPWLLAGIALAVAVLGLTFGIGGAGEFRLPIGLIFIGLLVGGSGLAVLAAVIRPRRRR